MKLDLHKISWRSWAVLLLFLLPGPGCAEQAVATVDLEWVAKVETGLAWKGNLKLRPLTGEGAVRTVAVEGKTLVRLDLPVGSVWDLKVEVPGVWAPATTVEASPAGSASVRRIELWPTAPVTGTVRMADPKQSLPREIGATLESPPGPARGREIPRGSVSCPVDPKGAFRCEMPAVRIDVAFRAGSFVPQYRWGLNLRPGQNFPVGNLELKLGASLKGWVETEGGPIAAGKCIARLVPMVSSGHGDVQLAERLRRSTAEAQVRPDGFFQLAGFAPGSYQLEVSQPGYAPAKVFPIDVWAGSETALKQAVVLKRPVQIDLSLAPPADWLGKPWNVRIFRGADTSTGTESEPAFAGAPDVEGRIRITGQTPGNFWVKVMDSAGNGLLYKEFTAHGPEDGQQNIEIPLVTLQGSLSLGRRPLAARLFFGERNAAVSIKMEADEKGRFHGVLPRQGTWPVEIRSDDGAVETVTKVKITADQLGRASAEIRLPDTHVFGSVVNEESRPVPGAEVALASGTDVIQAETDGEGRFEMRGASEGPVQLLARQGSRDAHSASDIAFLSLSDSQDVGPIQLRLRRMKTVTGRIQGAHGPVVGATVLVQPLQPPLGFSGSARTGLDGAFSVEVPAQAEVVQATVSPPGYALKAFQFEPDGIPVVLNVSEDGGTLEFSLPYSGEDALEIGLAYLVFQNGLPLAAPQLMPWAKGHGSPYAGATGADFQVPNLAPGDYRVCVVPRAGMTAWALSGWTGGIAECAAGSLSSGGTLRLKVYLLKMVDLPAGWRATRRRLSRPRFRLLTITSGPVPSFAQTISLGPTTRSPRVSRKSVRSRPSSAGTPSDIHGIPSSERRRLRSGTGFESCFLPPHVSSWARAWEIRRTSSRKAPLSWTMPGQAVFTLSKMTERRQCSPQGGCMPGPARAGLFVYAVDAQRIASFYESIAGMSRLHETPELIVLESPDLQLLVHSVPEQFAADIVISSPPVRREKTALKFFFTVPSLAEARAKAAHLGGEVFTENWRGPGFIVCNAMDPEGNVFQVRESAA